MLARSLLVCAALLAAPAAAAAAPPPNDARTQPQSLTLPASVTGTTRDSTLEADEPPSCVPLRGSVFYEVTARTADAVVVRLRAAGDLDASVEVFRRVRSQLEPVDCDVGDERGRAELTFDPERGGIYVIRVGQRSNSVPGRFRLAVFAPGPPPEPPGPQLPARGVRRRLDAVQDTSDAWSTRLRAGTTYRFNLVSLSGRCMSLGVYAPGTSAFDDEAPLRLLRCGGYRVFTPGPGEGGRYSFLVRAQPRARGPQRYHLQVAPARRDDLAPGRLLRNYAPRRGRLRGGGIDAVDLYRFSVDHRSALELDLRGGGFALLLLDDSGRRLGRADAGRLEGRIGPGRYYVAVLARFGASGRYRLTRASRTITRAAVTIDGAVRTAVPLHAVVRVGVRVTPGVSGRARVTIERFDPLSGWHFARRVAVPVVAGSGAYAFAPPAQGRWRASAEFMGTRLAAPSTTGYAHVLVAPPLSP